MTPARSLVVLLSHRLCDTTLSRLDALRQGVGGRMDIVLALTEPLGRAAAGLGLTEAMVLGRPDIFLPEHGAKAASRRIVPGNPDLVMLAVRRARPGYRRYWYVEYDVWFAGGAAVLAELDDASDADLLLPLRAIPRSTSPNWRHWPGVAIPPEEAPAVADPCHGLLCLHRASDRLLDTLDAAYRRGWAGHYEATLPTVALAAGLETGRINDVSRKLGGRPLIRDGTFHPAHCAPQRPDMIYHPVKTIAAERLLRDGHPVARKS